MNEEEIKNLFDKYLNEKLEDSISSLELSDNNTNVEAAHLRDIYLEAENAYILRLLEYDEVKKMIREVNLFDGSQILKKVEEIIYQVENNLISYDDMENVEIKLTVLLAAIKDKVLVKILKLYPDYEEEIDLGRSR